MNSISSKFILTVASIFALLNPSFIKISESELNFDFKTGNNFPIYYFLNFENVGNQKARFDISTNVDWLFVYREGLAQQTNFVSVELPQYSPINIILEIHPQRLKDGKHQAEIEVKAIQLQDYSTLDSKKILVFLNKNIEITPTPLISKSPEVTKTSPPIITPTPQPLLITPTPPSKIPTPLEKTPSFITPSPEISPPLKTPSPEITPLPKKIKPTSPFKSLINSLRNLIKFILGQ